MQNRLAWYNWLLLAFLLPLSVHAQDSPAELLQCIRSAPDRARLQPCLSRLWQMDSNQTYLVADAVHLLYEQQGQPISRSQADTLLRIYRIGSIQDRAGANPWLQRRALLAQSQSQFYPRHVLRWSIEAISAAPDEVDSYLVLETAHTLAHDYKANLVTLNNAAKSWAVIDHTVLQRQLNTGIAAKEWADVQAEVTLEMRSAMPDCNQLQGNFAEALQAERLNAEGCESFLILYSLQGCDAQTLWEKALAVALKNPENPWLFRLAADEAFNRRKFEGSRQFWQQALALETNVALRAQDQLQLAMTFRAEKDYRMARKHIQEAMKTMPGWGEPYIQLMDLYLEGSEICTMTDFERKAFYWLLIELCQTLNEADASYAEVADERYFAYLKQCPTTEEAAFQGWNPGDSYPIKCWMSTATRVK